MSVYSKTKATLVTNKLQPKKKFGQNFLVHRQTAESIAHVSGISREDTVFEVGVGLGALTVPLAERAGKVIGLEIDKGIVRFHQEQEDLPKNVELIHKDVLKTDFTFLHELNDYKKLKIVANLPYSISNPFIFKLIENEEIMESGTIMLQKEVADRLTAPPNTKDYGIPTVLLRRCANVHKLMTLKPAEFHPRPKIDSVVVKIEFNQQSYDHLGEYDSQLFTQIVRAAFSQRRKTILNTISNCSCFASFGLTERAKRKEITEEIIDLACLSATARAETLDIPDFINLSQKAAQLLSKQSG